LGGDLSIDSAAVRSRGGPTTKTHAVTHGCGRAVALTLGARNHADIPSTRSRIVPVPSDAEAYIDRNLIERAIKLASAIAIAAIVIWWT